MAKEESLRILDEAARDGKLSKGAVANIRAWLTEPRYAIYAPAVEEHLAAGKWVELDDAFWTVIPFGTGGRRGRMYPIGSNAINDRTIGESAQGLASYVRRQHRAGELSCAIAYDTRHNSRHFAELCAGIMVAAGFRVYFLDDYRSTPELSFLVRYKNCSCGIMVTASHNPPSDNAVKVYWSTGGQVLPPHDAAIIHEVMNVAEIQQVAFAEARERGQVEICTAEVDQAFIAAVAGQRFAGPRDLKILYSPLHGVGTSAVLPALQADGFTNIRLYEPHAQPSGDFPNVPGRSANPENPAVFDGPAEVAQREQLDIILATDPDCDRLGCSAPLSSDPQSRWKPFTGNQIGALLTDYILEQRKRAGQLTPDHYVVKTLVTTEMIRRIAESYNVKTYGDLLVGFKYIGGIMDQMGPDKFVFGTEESHGYLVGQYARDKDGAVASMLLAELAAQCKQQRQTLHEKLDALYWQHGYHAESLLNITMEGSQGMARMQALMEKLRTDPPAAIAGERIARVRDYLKLQVLVPGEAAQPLEGPTGDLIILDFEQAGNAIAARPSGTEPKVKFYEFAFTPAEQLASLDTTRQQTGDRMKLWEQSLRELIATIP